MDPDGSAEFHCSKSTYSPEVEAEADSVAAGYATQLVDEAAAQAKREAELRNNMGTKLTAEQLAAMEASHDAQTHHGPRGVFLSPEKVREIEREHAAKREAELRAALVRFCDQDRVEWEATRVPRWRTERFQRDLIERCIALAIWTLFVPAAFLAGERTLDWIVRGFRGD
ncbi:MAG: hypothetical protein FJ033_16125 [Chloroflexi bacterium]|nr:hypothetical protein [Chloroflexota bacterium]